MPKPTADSVRVAHYTRIAHASDNRRERLTRQAERARTQLHAHPDWILTETTTDLGSGLRIQPGLRQLLNRAHAGRSDLLLVERPSDLGRSRDILARILTELHVAGVDLCTLDGDHIDTATGHPATAVLTVDEDQRSTLTERHKQPKG